MAWYIFKVFAFLQMFGIRVKHSLKCCFGRRVLENVKEMWKDVRSTHVFDIYHVEHHFSLASRSWKHYYALVQVPKSGKGKKKAKAVNKDRHIRSYFCSTFLFHRHYDVRMPCQSAKLTSHIPLNHSKMFLRGDSVILVLRNPGGLE